MARWNAAELRHLSSDGHLASVAQARGDVGPRRQDVRQFGGIAAHVEQLLATVVPGDEVKLAVVGRPNARVEARWIEVGVPGPELVELTTLRREGSEGDAAGHVGQERVAVKSGRHGKVARFEHGGEDVREVYDVIDEAAVVEEACAAHDERNVEQ